MKRNTGLLAVICLVAGSTLFVAAPSRAGGGGGCRDGRLTDARTTQVDMSNMCFRPTVARVDVGDIVKFINEDNMVHGVGGIAGTFGDLYGQITPGRSVSYKFYEEGVFPYVCVFHPSMGGAIATGRDVLDPGCKMAEDFACSIPLPLQPDDADPKSRCR